MRAAVIASSNKVLRPQSFPLENQATTVQRALTAAMRDAAGKSRDIHRMQAWAGQGAALGGFGPVVYSGDQGIEVGGRREAILSEGALFAHGANSARR
jgi:hypothetical protein